MTQNPGSPEPSREPIPPAPSGYPGYPGYPSGPSGPLPPAPHRRRRFGLVGIVAVVAVIGAKILVGFGLGGLFHHVEHREGDAEKVVQAALAANTASEFTSYIADGVPLKSVIDPACQDVLQAGGYFKIPKSNKEGDGSADVTVDFQDSSTNAHFHLVDNGGWKIDRITCS